MFKKVNKKPNNQVIDSLRGGLLSPVYSKKKFIFGIVLFTILIIGASYAYFNITNSTDTEFNLSLDIDKEATVTLTTGEDILNIVLDYDDMNEDNIGTTYYFTKVSDLVNTNRTTTKTSDNIATLGTVSVTDGVEDNIYECTADITVSSSGDMKSGLSLGDAVYYIDNSNSNISIEDNSFDLSTTTTKEITFYIERTSSLSDTLDIDGYASISNTSSDQNSIQGTSLSISTSISNLSCGVYVSNVPKEYREVKYLQNSGTQYIDTGIVPDINYGIELQYYIPNKTGTGTPAKLLGTSKRNDVCDGCWGGIIFSSWETSPSGQGSWFGGVPTGVSTWGKTLFEPYLSYGTISNLKIINNYYETDSFSGNISKNTLNYLFGNLYLFAINGDIKIELSMISIKIYKFASYNSETKIQNFIPAVRKSDSKPGMYDTVSKTFFTNSGTGEFGYETLDGVYVSPT